MRPTLRNWSARPIWKTLNAHFIHQGLAQGDRLTLLNQTAIQQMKLLLADPGTRRLGGKHP